MAVVITESSPRRTPDRILHVADAFEAMTAARPYRMTPLTPEQALTELRKFAGIQFDPLVVDAFVRTAWVDGIIETGSKPPELRAIPTIGQVAERMTDRMTKPTTVSKPRGRTKPKQA
jgi:hypothetical protein